MKTGYSVSKEIANPFLVRQRDPGRLRGLWRLVAIVLPFAAAVFAYTWVHEQGLEAGYRIEALEQRLEDLLQEERLLELEATRLTRPERLSALALEQLGMAPPTLDQMIFLNSESASLVRAGTVSEAAQ
ncbi:MAG: cell division protein FtsL [Acidobacteria bacterium]|nr:cell division protein FtsL [Acidobacteriota bacterium]